MKYLIPALLMGITCMQPAFADDLLDVISRAHANDPTYRQAQDIFHANVETLSQARSLLFPIVQGQATKEIYNKSITTLSRSPGFSSVQTNKGEVFNVSVAQPLFNLGSWVEIRRSHQVVNQAEATVRSAELSLYIRAANAYFDVLAAKDALRFAEAEKRANARQLDQVEQRFKVGLEAITAKYDAQASYDAVVSRKLAAENQVNNAMEALRAITGELPTSLATLRESPPLTRPIPCDPEVWVKTAKAQNFDIIAQHFAAETARYVLKAQHAAFSPTLNLVGDYTDSRNGASTSVGVGNLGGVNNITKVVSLQLTSPVFQGGALISKSRQARDNYEAALAAFVATERGTVSAVRQAYNNVISGISTVRADQQAVKSSQASMESTEAAYRVGTRTIVDLLIAQRDLFNNQRQLSTDTYTYVRAILELKHQAGTLTIRDLQEINSWLVNAPSSTATNSVPNKSIKTRANRQRIKST